MGIADKALDLLDELDAAREVYAARFKREVRVKFARFLRETGNALLDEAEQKLLANERPTVSRVCGNQYIDHFCRKPPGHHTKTTSTDLCSDGQITWAYRS